ncbi:response regulator [Spirosoma utsteinense]|uniref:CheY-like chemotaxis protein n=1 Tax=Spirosoma utsteinense TaxID=2585773 RepID=A0ABR6WCI5_9BACT|nr:response regulator [Spirosoma utsteinense]MBC3788366.1 CheY-like chemotaxis protein [Spirosoma utsteinense]MBC3794283.1 CheY-like chemotaxis protein [Spirosoma utsteinense]
MNTTAQPLIYLVDDDLDEHFLLQKIFNRHHTDCTLRYFTDGAELVTHLTHCLDGRLPNLIVLDWNLPVLSGTQVLQLLKQDCQWRGIPVVVRSGSEQENDIKSSYELGAQAFIMKAGNYQQLVNSVTALRYRCLN